MSWKIVFVSAKYNRNQRLSSKFLWNLNQLEDTLKTLDSQRGGKSEKWLIGLGLILLSSWSIGSQPPPPTSRINQWTNQHPLSITILNQSRPLFLIYISPKNHFHSSPPTIISDIHGHVEVKKIHFFVLTHFLFCSQKTPQQFSQTLCNIFIISFPSCSILMSLFYLFFLFSSRCSSRQAASCPPATTTSSAPYRSWPWWGWWWWWGCWWCLWWWLWR